MSAVGILHSMRILITGSTGMLGKAIKRELEKSSASYFLNSPSSQDLDLRDMSSVREYLKTGNFDLVIHCAALVGGIKANIQHPFEYLNTNVRIDSNLMTAAQEFGIQGFMYMASSCMYPANTKQPMTENQLLTGPLEKTNEGYALAKLVGTKTVESLSAKLNWHTFILSNMYGSDDKYGDENSHLIAASISKVSKALNENQQELEMWGSGSARREFTYVNDVAKYLVNIIPTLASIPTLMNLGSGIDYSIREYYEFVCEEFEYQGKIVANLNGPEGVKQKLMDISLAKAHGWTTETNIRDGIRATIEDFLNKQGVNYGRD